MVIKGRPTKVRAPLAEVRGRGAAEAASVRLWCFDSSAPSHFHACRPCDSRPVGARSRDQGLSAEVEFGGSANLLTPGSSLPLAGH